MKNTVYLVALSLTTSLAFADAQTAIESIRARYELPALAAARINDGQMTASAFTGVRKLGDPTVIQSNDRFHLGSCTKSMTATLIGVLVERGKTRWDSTLGEIFPEVKMNSDYQGVTLEMIAAHRGGLPSDVSDLAFWERLRSIDPVNGRKLLLDSTLRSPPTTPPGSAYGYSNLGYILLGSVIDRLTETSWESFIQAELFAPLQMSSCGFGAAGDPQANPPDEPWGHTQRDSQVVPVAPDRNGDNPPAMSSAGNVHCSLSDWAKFLQMHSDGYNGKAGLLLTPETFQKLHTSYPGQEYTYGGWILTQRDWAGGPALTHNGSNTFNLAGTWIAPLKGIILMAATNIVNDQAIQAYGDALRFLVGFSN